MDAVNRLGPRPFALAFVGALAVYAFGRCEGREAASDDWHARNVAKLTKQVRVERVKTAAAIAAKDGTGRMVVRRSTAVDVAQDTLADVLAEATAALADSAASLTTLRETLGRTASAAHGLSVQVDSLQAAIVRDAAAHLAERAAFQATIAAQDAVIAAQRQQIRALTPSPLKRLWAVTCTATLAGTGAAIGSLLPAPPAPFLGAALGVAVAEGPCR